MKVILTQEIKGHGGEGDVVEVKTGFAVNYLFPKKLAIKATAGELKQLEQRRHNIQKREATRMDDASASVAYLSEKMVVIPMKVGDEGRLFGSVTAIMVAEALKAQHDIDIDRRKIEVRSPIKELGDHQVEINVYRELKAPVIVKVISDGETIDIGMTAEEAGELSDAEEKTETAADSTDVAPEDVASSDDVADVVIIEDVIPSTEVPDTDASAEEVAEDAISEEPTA